MPSHETQPSGSVDFGPTGPAKRAFRSERSPDPALLQLDRTAGLLELGLELVGLLALDALLDRLGSLVNERLGLFQAKAGRRADDLDHLNLLVARCGENHVDRARGLLLGATVAPTGRCGGHGRSDGCSRYAELLLERLDPL